MSRSDESDDDGEAFSTWIPEPIESRVATTIADANVDDVEAADEEEDPAAPCAPAVGCSDPCAPAEEPAIVKTELQPAIVKPELQPAIGVVSAPKTKARLNAVLTSDGGVFVCDHCQECVEFVPCPGRGTACRTCGCDLLMHLANESDGGDSDDFEFDSEGGREDWSKIYDDGDDVSED
jgi:hypothetical protein